MHHIKSSVSSLCLLALTGVLLVPVSAQAAATQDAGSLLQSIEKALPPTTKAPKLEAPAAAPQVVPQVKENEVRVLVNDFKIENAQQFSEDELKAVLKDTIGKQLTLAEIQAAARKIDDFYREKGFMARALLPKQVVKDGVIHIRILEGKLGKIKVDQSSNTRFDHALAEGIVSSRMPHGQTMRMENLREGVVILNEIPGVAATASLEAGENEGETDAVLKLADKPILSGTTQISNEGVRSVGTVRGVGTFSVNDAFGIGDQTTFSVVKSYLSDYGRLSYAMPVGTSGLTMGVNGSAMEYAVDTDINSSDQKGYAYTFGTSAAYPFLRRENLSLTGIGTYDHKKLVNSVLDMNSSNKVIDVGSVGANAILQDAFLAGATNAFSATVHAGRLDLSRNDSYWSQDTASAKTNGLYSKYAFAASRLQSFDEVHQLYVSANGQYASKNLDSSEQFSLGGQDGVRAYPVNEGMGSSGFLSRIELRHNVYDGVQLFDFYDAGWVQQYASKWSGWNASSDVPNDYWLQGIGVGVNWHPIDAGSVALTVAHTIGTNPGKVDGKNNDGYNDKVRVLVSASLAF